MSEKLFLAMNENEQLEFIKKYADEHKNMTQAEREKFYDLITKEKKDGESEYYYGGYVIFLLSDKVYEAILKNIGFGCDELLLSNCFFSYATTCFKHDGKITTAKYVNKNGIEEYVETKIIDQDKFSRFFIIFLRQLNNFQKAFLQTKMLAQPNLFYMFPTEIQNELNKNLGLSFKVKTDAHKITFDMIYQKHNKLFTECSYNVGSDGHCAVRAANMGYRIFKGDYFKNKNEIKDDMTKDECIALRKEAYKLTGVTDLVKQNYCGWTNPAYVIEYFNIRNKKNGNESVPYFVFGIGKSWSDLFQSYSNLEENSFASILSNCIVANQVNKNHFRCLKEDYETRKKYLIGFCDTLCDLAIVRILYDQELTCDLINGIEGCLLAPLWDIRINNSLFESCVPEEEKEKIDFAIRLALSTFATEQKCFVAVKLIEFIYGQYKKALEENKWSEITSEKISQSIHDFREIIESDKSLTKVAGSKNKGNFIYQIDHIQKMFIDDDIKEIFSCYPDFKQNNDEDIKKTRSQALSKWTSGKKTKQYLEQRVNDYSYFFYTLDEESIKIFLDKKIFPWQKFNIYNDRPDIQILALENMDEETKKILLDTLDKDNSFFDGCADDVRKRLTELGIITGEQKDNEKDNDNKKINEQSLNEFENYLSDLKNNFPDVLKDYEKKLADIKIPEKLSIDTKDFGNEINKLKNEIDEKVKQAKQKKLDEEKIRLNKENEDKKKNDLKLIKKCAVLISAAIGNKDACKIIDNLTDEQLNDFYNRNKDMLEKIKAELRKKENIKELGLKEEDFLSSDFKLDDKKIAAITNKFSDKDSKKWFVGLGIGEAASVVLIVSMIFVELPVLAIGFSPIAIGFLVGLICKSVELKQKSSERKRVFNKMKVNELEVKNKINDSVVIDKKMHPKDAFGL